MVLPTFNRAHVVVEAIDSVLTQTFGDFELIVVDDNSTDDSAAVLAEVSDPRLRVLPNTRTKGVSGARNTGIFAAKGEWLCQIDSDDLWEPRFLEKICEAIDRADERVGIVYGSLAFVEAGSITQVRSAEAGGYTYPRMLYEHFFYHTASAFRTSLVRELGGYDESLSDNEDADLQLRLTEHCEMLPVPEAMYFYRRDGGDRITRGYAAAAVSMKRYLDKHAKLFAQHPTARFRAVNNVMSAALRGGRWRLAFAMWLSLLPALVNEPRLFGRYQVGALRLVGSLLLDRRQASAR